MRTILSTVFALTAFAANSILCRLALGNPAIDPASFTTIRLLSGAVALLLISTAYKRRIPHLPPGNWRSAALLFLYAICFSFAYVGLSIGTGALILFASVQATMILAALTRGEKPRPLEWSGLALALAGLVYLVFPGLTAPPPVRSVLMIGAGASWGFYSLRVQTRADALLDTTDAFVRSIPFTLAVSILMMEQYHVSGNGLLLAIISGALASGLGYVAWNTAVQKLSATRAAIVQLTVPILAAGGGVIFLSEEVSFRLLLSAAMILGGVALSFMTHASSIRRQDR